MPSITKHHNKGYTYIYETTSFWDAERKYPDNQKKSIGRIDSVSGETYFKQEYVDRLKKEGKPTDDIKIWYDRRKSSYELNKESEIDVLTIAQEILSSVKSFGLIYFLQSVAKKAGLMEIMRKSIPNNWEKLLLLACYLVAENKPVMYCADWVEDNEYFNVGSMSSQRISELLSSFGYNERVGFFKHWYQHIREKEYIALDITSVSSYSENIGLLGFGHNRDGEKLPQVNICMLLGEKSRMPVYQSIYNGNLNDVSTLKTTLDEFEAITGTRDILIVMDKGFFSAKNVNYMLGGINQTSYKFLIPVSFTSKFAQEHVKNECAGIDDVDNVILTGDTPIRGVYRLSNWMKDVKLHTHVYFDPERALKERNDVYAYVAKLKKLAMDDPKNSKFKKDFNQYLNFDEFCKTDDVTKVTIRKEAIDKMLAHSGWFVLISNHISDPQEAYDIYRAKDVVEKSFFQYKNNLGLSRLHVHSDERTLNKTFVAFIALIISSYIHKIMREKHLDDNFTFDKLLNILAKLKIAHINSRTVIQPLTKEQKLIFKSFDIAFPDVCVGQYE